MKVKRSGLYDQRAAVGRITDREKIPLEGRVTLLEADMDDQERSADAIRTILVGVLISLATAAVLLAVNVLLKQ